MTTPASPDPATCAACGQVVASFAQWFEEPCPTETPDRLGHQLTRLQLQRKQFAAHPERQEVTQP